MCKHSVRQVRPAGPLFPLYAASHDAIGPSLALAKPVSTRGGANRETHLAEVPGFVAFKLLRGPEHADHTLFVSHTLWASKEAFEAWTRSDAFRQAHASAGVNKDMYLGPPQFEGFEVVQSQT